MGLLLGIVGDMLVSYWMEFIKGVRAGLDIPLWIWALGTTVAFLVVLYLIRLFYKESIR